MGDEMALACVTCSTTVNAVTRRGWDTPAEIVDSLRGLNMTNNFDLEVLAAERLDIQNIQRILFVAAECYSHTWSSSKLVESLVSLEFNVVDARDWMPGRFPAPMTEVKGRFMQLRELNQLVAGIPPCTVADQFDLKAVGLTATTAKILSEILGDFAKLYNKEDER